MSESLQPPQEKNKPIVLSQEEYAALRSDFDPSSPRIASFMEQHGLQPGQEAIVQVEDRIFPMNTSPEDFGTRIEYGPSDPVADIGALATKEASQQ